MVRLLGLSFINKNVLEAAVLALLALSSFIIARQFNHASAASTSGQVHLLNASTASENAQPASADQAPSSDSASTSSNTSNNSVTVNGQRFEVPPNGSLNQTVTDGNTTTTINAQNSSSSSDSQGQASNTNSSSVNVQVNSSSGGSAEGDGL